MFWSGVSTPKTPRILQVRIMAVTTTSLSSRPPSATPPVYLTLPPGPGTARLSWIHSSTNLLWRAVAYFAAALAVCVTHVMSIIVSRWPWAAVLLFGIIFVTSTSWSYVFSPSSAQRPLSLQMRCNWISTCTRSE